MSKFTVSEKTAPSVRNWFINGRGARLWKSAEIGNSRPEQLTPGDVTTPPHWAYPLADSELIGIDDIAIEAREKIPGAGIRSRILKKWWGVDIHESGKAKAQKKCDALASSSGRVVEWHMEFCEFGIAHIEFEHVTSRPFAEFCATSPATH